MEKFEYILLIFRILDEISYKDKISVQYYKPMTKALWNWN